MFSTRHLRLWPLFLFLILEAVLLVVFLFYVPDRPAVPYTPFSAVVAILVLFSGLLPALLRPSLEHMLAGALAAILAGILLTPVSPADLPQPLIAHPFNELPGYLIYRLVNGALLGPLAFHLTARFPLRSPISDRLLAGVYALSLGSLAILLWVNIKAVRVATFGFLLLWMIGLVVAAFYLLLRASRDTQPDNRRAAQQARLLFASVALAEIPALLRPIGLALQVEIMPYNLFLAAQILVPAGITYAVLRHDLFGIDNALRRALAYTVLSILLLVLYLGLTVGLSARLVEAWPDFPRLAALLSLLIAALAFEPLRRRLQAWIDRALYPDRLNFLHAIAEAQAALERVVSREEVIRLLQDELPRRLGATWASLTLAPAPDVPGRADSEPAWNSRLIVGGKSLGRYWLGPRRAGPGYDGDEQTRLQALAGQAALALAYSDLIEELRQLNRELEQRVTERTGQVLEQQRALAAYNERQRLARELHDSVTQALFSMNLSARALRGLVGRDPQAASQGLSELEQAAQQALGEMRALLQQLRAPVPPAAPPVPGEEREDLVGLLQEHCQQLEREMGQEGQPMLEVDLQTPAELFLPATQAHDLFQVTREALHNVIKHSGRRQALCQVSLEGGWLRLRVQDDGAGFNLPGSAEMGFGLRGMQERLEALGGELHIQTRPGEGTLVEAKIPIQEQAQ
ncbi:MAG: sensor histidine kinase [Anaerolineales bacterium]|nr:sensor histidine kinase [Anaerolineales bacterium]